MEGQTSVALLGLDGFAVTAAEQINGEMHVHVELDGSMLVGCPECGVVPAPAALKERNTVRIRDLPVAGRPTVLVWSKRRWRCVEPACPRKSFTETHPDVRPRRALTERARKAICRLVGKDAEATAAVARDFGVGWHTAWGAVVDYGQPKVDDPARTAAVASLGVDSGGLVDRHPRPSHLVCLRAGRLGLGTTT